MQQTTETIFKRKRAIETTLLTLELKQPVFIKVDKYFVFETKEQKKIPAWLITNLKTGEMQTMWLDGGLRAKLSLMGGVKELVGFSLEITKTGTSAFQHMTEGEVQMNTYDVFEIA